MESFWKEPNFMDWIVQFRISSKIIVYKFILLVKQVLSIYESNSRQHYKDYIELQNGIRLLWSSWTDFASAKEVNEAVLADSPVFFNYKMLIQRMRTPRGVKVASKMSDIRESARTICQEAFTLQGHLMEIQQRVEDAVAEECEDAIKLPLLNVVDVPSLDPIVEIQLVSGEPVTAAGEKFEVSLS
jgi:hypothetical protein